MCLLMLMVMSSLILRVVSSPTLITKALKFYPAYSILNCYRKMSLEAHKPKKQKVEEAAAAAFAGAEQDNEATTTDTTTAIVAAQRNANGEAFFDLSKTRRVTVRQFKGKTLVDIREFYEKDGKVLPGKKGISLNLEQYEALRDLFLGGQVEQEITNLE